MLMTSVSQDELYEKCCARAQDSSDIRENFQHPTRLINFLVGQKGKNEVMAIGGPWSPSLDGADPVNDTSVLIKTAIRTTKALAGIDLTACTQWYVPLLWVWTRLRGGVIRRRKIVRQKKRMYIQSLFYPLLLHIYL